MRGPPLWRVWFCTRPALQSPTKARPVAPQARTPFDLPCAQRVRAEKVLFERARSPSKQLRRSPPPRQSRSRTRYSPHLPDPQRGGACKHAASVRSRTQAATRPLLEPARSARSARSAPARPACMGKPGTCRTDLRPEPIVGMVDDFLVRCVSVSVGVAALEFENEVLYGVHPPVPLRGSLCGEQHRLYGGVVCGGCKDKNARSRLC